MALKRGVLAFRRGAAFRRLRHLAVTACNRSCFGERRGHRREVGQRRRGGGIWHLRDGVWAPGLPHARQKASPPSHLSDFIEVFRVPADLATQQSSGSDRKLVARLPRGVMVAAAAAAATAPATWCQLYPPPIATRRWHFRPCFV